MMLTTKGRYAVMAMVDIAIHTMDNNPITLAEIAGRQDITVAYLEQIFCKLRKNALVKSVKGPGGGYILAQEPEGIKISCIIQAVDETIKMTRCEKPSGKSGKGCVNGKRCLTHDLWEGLGHRIYEYLDSVSLADVCEGKLRASAPVLAEFVEQTANV